MCLDSFFTFNLRYQIDKEQTELARANFSILRKEAQAILDLVTRDANQGSEAGKTISFYVLDAFISIDQDSFFLSQLQSRGFLRACLTDVSNIFNKDISGNYTMRSFYHEVVKLQSVALSVGDWFFDRVGVSAIACTYPLSLPPSTVNTASIPQHRRLSAHRLSASLNTASLTPPLCLPQHCLSASLPPSTPCAPLPPSTPPLCLSTPPLCLSASLSPSRARQSPPRHRLCGLSRTDCAASPSHHQHHRPNHAFDLALTPNFVANTLSGTSVYTVRRQQFQVGHRRP
ncbi:hypothetical protein Syun_029656 [Stephania yunnanensis]|uniref:Uncharacterized protein n=1 Tax=Stephania yunnanensis TaxID=152371 RepID=A0AAP0E9C4_9MAGN